MSFVSQLCLGFRKKSKLLSSCTAMRSWGESSKEANRTRRSLFRTKRNKSTDDEKPIPWSSMLIVFGGLPGTGKTTLARELSRRLVATYVRIDTLEQAILQSHGTCDAGPAGYIAGYAVALDNLALGLTVVA